MTEISVFSRAHRALRGIPRFRFLRDDTELAAELLQRYGADSLVGEAIGIYNNPEPTQPEAILITDRGIITFRSGATQSIQLSEVVSVQGPPTKANASRIALNLRSGMVVNLDIHGGDDKFRDVFGFIRFLDRVIADQ